MAHSLSTGTVVAVIGAGSMGAGIAQLAAQSGHAVRLHDAQPGAAERGLARVAGDLDSAVKRGRLDAAARDEVMARITIAPTLDALAGCGLVVEAIVEKLEPKQALFRQLEPLLDADAVLATNTSSISITAVAQGLARPERLVGWHFFNPPTRMKLVEIIPGLLTDRALVPALHHLSRAWGKLPVDAPNAPGFIVNRVARPYYAEGLRLLAEGVAPAPSIDRLLREAGGFALGPFELIDLIGVDVNLSVTESVFAATGWDTRYAPHLIQQELVRAGRLGRKTGHGFYGYGDGTPPPAAPAISPESSSMAEAGAWHVGVQPGALAPLVDRLRAGGAHLRVDASLPPGTLRLGEVRVGLTDGRTRAERAATDASAWLLLDLARDWATTPLVGATGRAEHLALLASALQPAGIGVIALADVAGLVVMRTVACLANEAADVMTWTGTRAADIDTAMRLGTAYPIGPLAWADALGIGVVVEVLAHLQDHYGDTRYRRAPALLARLHGGESFHV